MYVFGINNEMLVIFFLADSSCYNFATTKY